MAEEKKAGKILGPREGLEEMRFQVGQGGACRHTDLAQAREAVGRQNARSCLSTSYFLSSKQDGHGKPLRAPGDPKEVPGLEKLPGGNKDDASEA